MEVTGSGGSGGTWQIIVQVTNNRKIEKSTKIWETTQIEADKDEKKAIDKKIIMQIKTELKRLGTVKFWQRVRYWSAIKWTGKLTQPISDEEWLPITISILSGVALLSVIVCLLKLLAFLLQQISTTG